MSAQPIALSREVPDRSNWRLDVAGYLGTLCVVLISLLVSLQLWRADLAIPLIDAGDCLYARVCVLNVIESGWCYDGPRAGAPDAQDLRDFPMPDILHFAFIKLLSSFSNDHVVVFNLFSLLNFPLIALAAYFSLRRLGMGRMEAVVGSALFACAPYHFIRMGHHWLLCAFYLVPPMIWLILRVYTGWDPIARKDPGGDGRQARLLSWEVAGAFLICVLTGLAGIYYAFFSCFLLFATGIQVAVRERRWRRLLTPLFLTMIVSASALAALAPAIIHRAREGQNPGVATRRASEAEHFGLKVTEMLMPAYYHRSEAMRAFRDKWYQPERPATSSQLMPPLGIIASLGFVLLVGRFLWWRPAGREHVADGLAYLTVMTVGFASVGGFAALFAFFVTPLIRCYDRMSIFIAFFATAALFLFLNKTIGRVACGTWARSGYMLFLALLLLGGMYDQTPSNKVPYESIAKAFASDREFAHRLEAMLPAGSMVHQMPHMTFPEGPPVHELSSYELFRPLLHTRTLKFSFGAVRGRSTGEFFARLATLPLPERVDSLVALGFSGIYLDRLGYADGKFEAELASLLGVTPITSDNARVAYYSLSDRAATLQARHSPKELRRYFERLVDDPLLLWGKGCNSEEKDGAGLCWRWCHSTGAFTIVNRADHPIRRTLRFNVQSMDSAGGKLVLSGPLFEDCLEVSHAKGEYSREIEIPPGSHRVTFSCSAKPCFSLTRTLVLMFSNYQLAEALPGE